jgi:hypothetical protein
MKLQLSADWSEFLRVLILASSEVRPRRRARSSGLGRAADDRGFGFGTVVPSARAFLTERCFMDDGIEATLRSVAREFPSGHDDLQAPLDRGAPRNGPAPSAHYERDATCR